MKEIMFKESGNDKVELYSLTIYNHSVDKDVEELSKE